MDIEFKEVEKRQWIAQAQESIFHSLIRYFLLKAPSKQDIPQKVAQRVVQMLTQPGWPGFRLSPSQKQVIPPQITQLACVFGYSTSVQTISRFSLRAAQAFFEHMPPLKNSYPDVKKALEFAIKREISDACDAELAVNRAALYVHSRKTFFGVTSSRHKGRGASQQALHRQIVGVPQILDRALPSNDIRCIFLKMFQKEEGIHMLGGGKTLAGLIQKAHPFSIEKIQKALGEELIRLGRAVGFADKNGTIILFEIAHSHAAHEISLRKDEIIRRLRGIEGLEQVRDIRFKTASHVWRET